MKLKVLTTTVVALLLLGAMAGIRHIDQLNDGIEIKKIELKDNSARLQILNKEYEDLNKQLLEKDADTKKIEQDRKKLEKEKQELEKALQAKIKKKQADIAYKAEQAAKQALGSPQTAYASTNGCDELRSKLSRLGVPGHELDSAIQLAMRESSCNSGAVNAESGACGEFQSYPCGKWGTPGTDQYLSNAINYAKNRYGGYNGALSHSLANNWY